MENNNPNMEPQVPQNEVAPAPEVPQQPVAPVYEQSVAPANNNMPVLALVFGIIGIAGGVVLSWIPFISIITFVLSILGIVFGVKGRKTAPADKKGMATAGMVLGIIGVALGAIGVICSICTVIGIAALGTELSNYYY